MPRRTDWLSKQDARRIAVAAQGFGKPRPDAVGTRQLLRTVNDLSLHQIDSVNVLARAHYLPAFSRLGPYDTGLLDGLAWGRPSRRRLFEYWAHDASLLPLDLFPLLRWRMDLADRGEAGWSSLRPFARERRAEAEAMLERIREEGPIAASEAGPSKGQPGWWSWSQSKRVLEWLFWAGHVTTATRRRNFERVYDLTERVIPASVFAAPVPPPPEAHRQLLARASRALGIATYAGLRDYFRLPPGPARAALRQLVEDGIVREVLVEGQGQVHYLHAEARIPRSLCATALLAPFDPLIWERTRTEKLFDFHYRLEIYTPADKRLHGYYVLPFLLDDQLVGRVDLKADRANSRLLVRKSSFEATAPPHAGGALAAELAAMASWLGLGEVSRTDR